MKLKPRDASKAPFIVHQSTLQTWRKCRRLYNYQYVQHLEPKRRAAPLLRGTIVHEMIEAHLADEDPWDVLNAAAKEFDAMFRAEREFYGDMINDIRVLMVGYFRHYEKDPIHPIPIIDKHGKKRFSEHKFTVNLTPTILLKGKIDKVGTDSTKQRWLVDHKTYKTLPESDEKYTDLQGNLYTWAWDQIYPELRITGMLWNYIRWKPPTVPHLNKNGEMSRAKIDTLWTVYRQALKDAKLKVHPYMDMKAELDGRESEFYVREYLPISPKVQLRLVAEAVETAEEMRDRAHKTAVRSIDWQCKRCDFYELCQAELRGLDTDLIRKNKFRLKPEKDRENTEHENEAA